MATVYRFRQAAAVYVNGTRYMTAKDARKMARALNRVARSIESEKFAQSTCGSVELGDYGDYDGKIFEGEE